MRDRSLTLELSSRDVSKTQDRGSRYTWGVDSQQCSPYFPLRTLLKQICKRRLLVDHIGRRSLMVPVGQANDLDLHLWYTRWV